MDNFLVSCFGANFDLFATNLLRKISIVLTFTDPGKKFPSFFSIEKFSRYTSQTKLSFGTISRPIIPD